MLNTEIIKRILQENQGQLPASAQELFPLLFPIQPRAVNDFLTLYAHGIFNQLSGEKQIDFNTLQTYSSRVADFISAPIPVLNTWVFAWQGYEAQPQAVGTAFTHHLGELLKTAQFETLRTWLSELIPGLIPLEPTLAQALGFYQALAEFNLHNYQNALDLLQQVQGLDPQNTDYLYYTACCFAELGQTDSAIYTLEQILLFEPNSAPQVQARRDALLATQKLDYSLTDENMNHWLQAIQRSYYKADYAHTISLCSDVIANMDILPLTAEAYYFRGLAYYWDTTTQVAEGITLSLADLSQAIQRLPENNLYYTARGNIYLSRKEYAAARADFEQAYRLCPDDDQALQGIERLAELEK